MLATICSAERFIYLEADSPAGRTSVGLYHLAWDVDTLSDHEELTGVLADAGALVGATDHGPTKSIYGKNPDGLEFEVVRLVPAAGLPDSGGRLR